MARFRFIDIGANLVDEMYQGIYNGTKKHEPDLEKVLQRAYTVGLQKIFITAGNLEEAQNAAKLVQEIDNKGEKLFSTVGVHPTRCNEFTTKLESPVAYLAQLKNVIDENREKIIALGEFGLDYERTNFCDIETQKKFFSFQLTELGKYADLPLFLHCRAAAEDLHSILKNNIAHLPRGGVVHSFDGTVDEMKLFVELGLHIGINGCSLKTEENCNMVKAIPLESLLLETDSPWCGIRPSHFSAKYVTTKFETAKKVWTENSMYKQRNEPQTILNVLEVVAALKQMEPEALSEIIFENTKKLFCNQS